MIEKDDEEASSNPEDAAIVLAAIDTSAAASRVVDTASRLARRTWQNAQLHLLHVFRSAPFDRPSSVGLKAEDLAAEARSYLEHHLRMARRQCPVPVTGHFAEGDPVEEIVRVARSIAADWLIVGTHDLTGLEKLLRGSVAEKVARKAPCSVLIVRPKQRSYVKVG